MILITGAKGYVGRNLHIVDSVGIDRGNVDITNVADNPENTRDIEGIIHLAAIGRVRQCEKNPVDALSTNVVGTGAVLELAKNKNAWVIFASTREVKWGDSIYALTKIAGEELCNYYAKRYGIHVIVLRLGDVFGGDNHPTKAIPTIAKQARLGEDITLNDPDQVFYPIDIDVVVSSIGKAIVDIKRIDQKKIYYEIRDIAPKQGLALRQIADHFVKKYNSKSKIAVRE